MTKIQKIWVAIGSALGIALLAAILIEAAGHGRLLPFSFQAGAHTLATQSSCQRLDPSYDQQQLRRPLRVWVGGGGSLLAEEVVRATAEHLKEHPQVESVILATEASALPPDLWLFIELLQHERSHNLPPKRAQTVEVRYGMGPAFQNPEYPTLFQRFPLASQDSVTGVVRVQAEHIGLTLGSAFERKIADEIAGSIVARAFRETEAGFDLEQALPAFFYPSHTPFQLPASLAAFEPELLYSGPALFRHDVSTWRFTVPADSSQPLAQVRQALEEDWAIEVYLDEAPAYTILQLNRGPHEQLVIRWQAPEPVHPWGIHEQSSAETNPQPREFFIFHQHTMGDDEYRAATQRAFETDQPLDILFALETWWSPEQRQAFIAQALDLHDAGKSLKVDYLPLIVHAHPEWSQDKIRSLLLRSYLDSPYWDQKQAERFEEVANQLLGEDDTPSSWMNRQTLAAAGISVVSLGESVSGEIQLGQTFVMAAEASDETIRIYSCRVSEVKDGQEGADYRLSIASLQDGRFSGKREGDISRAALLHGQIRGGLDSPKVSTFFHFKALDPDCQAFQVTGRNEPLPPSSHSAFGAGSSPAR
ncbi:MAG: hypothetical protein Q7P63_05250 [Verrucomicrobiota bacterium JB022]|nr:hypothetical protein [Verrucomicrobiota bacterium JB022]